MHRRPALPNAAGFSWEQVVTEQWTDANGSLHAMDSHAMLPTPKKLGGRALQLLVMAQQLSKARQQTHEAGES